MARSNQPILPLLIGTIVSAGALAVLFTSARPINRALPLARPKNLNNAGTPKHEVDSQVVYQLPKASVAASLLPDLSGPSDASATEHSRDSVVKRPSLKQVAVERALIDGKSLTRKQLLEAIPSITLKELDSELSSNDKIVGVMVGKTTRFVLLDWGITPKVLTIVEFADMVSQKTGLLSGPAICHFITANYGWTPNVRTIGG